MKKATFVKRLDGRGEGRIYKLSPRLGKFTYVWVSAANVLSSGPETYIFGCNAKGEVKEWGELEGSFRGALDHERALRNAGYEVVNG